MKRTSTRINMIFYAWIMIAIYSDLRMFGLSADIILQCPEKFKDSELNLVSCEINSAASSCGASIVTISIQRSGSSTPVPLCNPDAVYPCTATAPVPTQHEQCACTKLDGNKFTYTLAYQADYTTDLGAKFVCQVCPGIPSTISNCDSIKFEDGCDSDPCQNGGTCNATSATDYICDCGEFFIGPRCEDWARELIVLVFFGVVVVVGGGTTVPVGIYVYYKPGKPLDLKIAVVTVNSMNLTWTAPKRGSVPFTYFVQYRPVGKKEWLANQPKTNEVTVEQLNVNTEYEFRVLAKNKVGTGPFTDIIKAKTTESQ